MQTNLHNRRYASVILPVKYSGEISYFLPEIFAANVGSRVKVDLAGKIYTGVISKILPQEEIPAYTPDGKEIQYKPILAVEEVPPVLPTEILLWERVAQYYMCTTGEVYKAAYPALQVKQESVKPRKTVEHFLQEVGKDSTSAPPTPQLSGIQQEAFNKIKASYTDAPGKPVLLRGVTGSGKTEIYITLALEQLRQGKNVLYMVPEIAISKQLQSRLKKVFGERLLTFHSKQTAAEKARIHKILQHNAGLAMDICSLEQNFEDTKEFEWLCENAADYGFILRYPEDKQDITKIIYEPWHWRYVGVEAAKEMKASGECLEEYLGVA